MRLSWGRQLVSLARKRLLHVAVLLAMIIGTADSAGAACGIFTVSNQDHSYGCIFLVCADNQGNIISAQILQCAPENLAKGGYGNEGSAQSLGF